MARINQNYHSLKESYLFSEISRRVRVFSERNPEAEIFRLGIGNTTEPLTPEVIDAMEVSVESLGNVETYSGYGDEQGNIELRDAIAGWYAARGIKLNSGEIFVSDGAKADTANIVSIFESGSRVAISDPVYPVYLDTNIIAGNEVVFMRCTPDNGFMPEIPEQNVDLIYICSPNNPTGAVISKKQLKKFVDYAIKNKSVIIFDAAYSEYISDGSMPRSIYEIIGAEKCAIEIQSFSKMAGFTGVRLGWTVVPVELDVEGSQVGEVNRIWNRRQTTMFNGASVISQAGGIAVLSKQGQKESAGMISYYMKNAEIIRKGLEGLGFDVYGGTNAPYLWVKTPGEMGSWEFFDFLLTQCRVVCTPGVGFGQSGEGFVRFSAFGHRADVVRAVNMIKKGYKANE